MEEITLVFQSTKECIFLMGHYWDSHGTLMGQLRVWEVYFFAIKLLRMIKELRVVKSRNIKT